MSLAAGLDDVFTVPTCDEPWAKLTPEALATRALALVEAALIS